jgi:hypothetical protein
LQIKTKIVSCHTADSKPVKQEVNGTVILPPLVFLGQTKWSTLRTGQTPSVTQKYFYRLKVTASKNTPAFYVSLSVQEEKVLLNAAFNAFLTSELFLDLFLRWAATALEVLML